MKRSLLTRKRRQWAQAREKQPVFKGSPLRPNLGSQLRYQRALQKLVKRMTRETRAEIEKLFKGESAQAYFAQDASVASGARMLMNGLKRRFASLFAEAAKPLAEDVVNQATQNGARSLRASLKELSGGLTIKTDIDNPALREIYKASVAENVNLIKSISSEYLKDVEGSVMRSITTGNGLEDLIPKLKHFDGISKRKAKNIALDQTRKVYNSVNRDRMKAIGIKKFMWIHSGGGANPRPDHQEMNGNIYSFDDLPVIDPRTGERGIPGQAVNCRCTMSPVLDFDND